MRGFLPRKETMERQDGGIYLVQFLEGIVPIRADYWGGPYIDLTFGTEDYHPSEVINVWDDVTDEPEIQNTVSAVAACVTRWMRVQNKENPGWLSQYLENTRWG